VDRGNDIFAIDLDGLGLRCAQRNVQHGAVLGGVDLLAGEHGFDVLLQP